MKTKKTVANRNILLLLFLFAVTNLIFCQSNNDLFNNMLNRMGGVELWKETKSLHIVEQMRAKALPEIIRQEIWRDLTKPATRFHLKSESMDRTRAFDEVQGWGILENGKSYSFNADRIKNEKMVWKRNFITICHHIANGSKNYTIKEKEGYILEVYNTTGEELLCTIELDGTFAPIKWESDIGGEVETYIYGPLKQFGKYNLPSWWTSSDGHWQYHYLSFSGSNKSPNISFLPPEDFKVDKD